VRSRRARLQLRLRNHQPDARHANFGVADYQPSNASNLARAAVEKGGPLTLAEKAEITKKGTAVAVPSKWHQQQSKTYGGRNKPAQIAADAADPLAAAERDSRAMVLGAKPCQRTAAAAAATEIIKKASKLGGFAD
jgi:hypothetical protein